MIEIKDQILEELGNLKLTTTEIKDPVFHKTALKHFLSSKEVRRIPNDHKDEFFQQTPSFLFPEYEEFFRNLDPAITTSEADYSNLTDGHNVSELFADSKRYRVTPDYLKYIKASKNDFVINVYGGEDTLITTSLWNFTDSPAGRQKFANGLIPPYQLASPDKLMCAVLEKATYVDRLLIESCRNYITVLAIDIPYSYYSGQILKGNIFTWNINEEKYQIGGMDISVIDKKIHEVAALGFEKPLVMRIDEGCLTPIDDETAILMFIATYLNLPTIPVVLYMSDEEVMKNRVIEELHDSVHSDMWHNPQALDTINNICKPYYFFELAKTSGENVYLQCNGVYMHKNQYPSMNDINDASLDVYNRYLDKSAKVEEIILPMTRDEIDQMIVAKNEEVMAKAREKIRLENEEINRKILAGEY